MYVIKRNNIQEPIHFDKITTRIKQLLWNLDENIDPIVIVQKITSSIYSGISTKQLDELVAETVAHMISIHPDYGLLAARIEVSNLHKETKKKFSDVIEDLYNYINPQTNKCGSLISKKLYDIVQQNKLKIDSTIVYNRDFLFDYFGIKTLMRAYLLKIDYKIIERPQHMFMRVAFGIHQDDIDAAIETYNYMSSKYFIHATPTLFNSGTNRAQMSSCFLLQMKDDSIDGIFETLKETAQISKNSGGIGIAIHNIRASGSYIKGTNGISNGIIPMLRVFNNTARYVNQGGKRKGSFAMYLEPWHADIFDFLNLRKNHGNEEQRARDLFLGLWIPDLYMKRVEEDGMWSLMCPNECKGLQYVWGEEFEELYIKYENDKKYKKQIKARDLWKAILQSQIETGTPYMCYKDSCNRKTNHQNLGTIQSSNLCTEIMEYTAPDETAVCNLASIALPKFYNKNKNTFDFKNLIKITKIITKNLNKIIDLNFYPVDTAKNSNFKHRPIGIGVQGLADLFMLLKIPFDSLEAKELNKLIFETIYYAALTTSNELAKIHGPYSTYQGSPVSKGILQFDMWNIKPSEKYNWNNLKKKIAEYGIRNSLLIAPMPTASTSQILGNNECFEPYTSNIYVRRTLAGEFICINKHLFDDCLKLGIWTPLLKDKLIAANGSVQNIDEIPTNLKKIYKTVWEISQKTLIDMSADRGAFIDQSQSFNVHMQNPNYGKLTSMHFHSWKKGLKTGLYYLRTKSSVGAIKFTVNYKAIEEEKQKNIEKMICSLENKDECTMCSG